MILSPDWKPVATAEIQFAGSRAFTRKMLPLFLPGSNPEDVNRIFPRYRIPEERSA
jgi:hypothetical protein